MMKPKRRPDLEGLTSEKDLQRALGCEGKIKYETPIEALKAAKELRKRIGARTKPYLCRWCSGDLWHIGHDRNRKERAMVSQRPVELT